MRPHLAGLMLALAASPALAQSDPRTHLHAAHHACLARAASRLDDGRSEAMAVAQAVAGQCQGEWDDLMAAYTGEMSPTSARRMRANLEPTRVRDATTAVLRGRGGR